MPAARCRLAWALALAGRATVAAPVDGIIYTNATGTAPPTRARGRRAQGRRLSLSGAQQQLIVDKHNTLRAGVTQPCTAADMETLVWDASLATASASWGQQCQWKHDPANGNSGWGENLAYRWSSAGNSITDDAITGSIQAWYDEVVDTQWLADGNGATSKIYANPSTQCQSFDGTDCMIGHYTQVVWSKSNKVGCAAVVCADGTLTGKGGFYLVCKYTPAGNMQMSSGATAAPWMPGASCAACAGSCSQGALCNAGSSPTRCIDGLGVTISGFTFNGVDHATCSSLVAAVTSWCSSFNSDYPYCDLTCGVCTVPTGVGMSSCGSGLNPMAQPTPQPTQQPTDDPTAPTPAAPTDNVNVATGSVPGLATVAAACATAVFGA